VLWLVGLVFHRDLMLSVRLLINTLAADPHVTDRLDTQTIKRLLEPDSFDTPAL
jgi:hypothetical protein